MELELDITEEAESEEAPKSDRDSIRAKDYILSPNDIDRNEICPAARVFVGPRDKPHHAMWHGIFMHRFLEYVLSRGHAAALQYVRSKKNKNVIRICEKIDVSKIPQHAIPEMKLLIDVEAGTAEASEREFAEPEKHFLGTADLVYANDGAKVPWNVGDYKSGDQHKISPKGNSQLLTLAVGIQLMQNVDCVRGSIIDIVKNGDLVWHTVTYTEKTLAAHRKRMRRVLMETAETRAEFRQEGAQPSVIPGPHCRGCRANTVCVGAKLVK